MFAKEFEKLTDAMIENGQCEKENREMVIYGLSMGIELLFNLLSTIVIGLFLGMLVESLLFLLAYPFLRTYAGGYHCEKAINCYFVSIGIIVIVLLLVKYAPTRYILISSLFSLSLSIPTILKLAPVDTINKKLDADEYKYFRKKTITNLIVECILIVILAVFKLYNYVFLISLSFLVTAFMLVLQVIVAKKQQNLLTW